MDRVVFNTVSKTYALGGGRKLLRGHVRDLIGRRGGETFHALRDITLAVRDGESLAIVGANGAGKSTLLNLASRLCYPDEGSVTVEGRLAAVLELGGGFHTDLTGAENVRLSASLAGISRKRTAELYDQIVEFSGVGDFIHEQVRTYSNGMVLRLAFSVAVHADPEVLLVDEVIAAGDQAFQTKSFDRMLELRKSGKTMLCVSHSPALLRQMCDRAIWLDHGQMIAQGTVNEVLAAYECGANLPAASGLS
jgi:ABC-type polysaccharide/polyol phosphate transport system ATPase subunit